MYFKIFGEYMYQYLRKRNNALETSMN